MTDGFPPQAPASGAEFVPARENPFRIEKVTRVKFHFRDGNWDTHLARLQALEFRAAIVGPQGTGKTTLLYELLDCIQHRGASVAHFFIPQETESHREMLSDALARSANGSIVLVDGMERFTWWQRWRLFSGTRPGNGLVANFHQPCRFPMRLPTWIQTSTSFELMEQILVDLGLDEPAIQSAGAEALQQANGNAREALRDLYDQFANGQLKRLD